MSVVFREPEGDHKLISRTQVKDEYLLKDEDLDLRKPRLRYSFLPDLFSISDSLLRNLSFLISADISQRRILTILDMET